MATAAEIGAAIKAAIDSVDPESFSTYEDFTLAVQVSITTAMLTFYPQVEDITNAVYLDEVDQFSSVTEKTVPDNSDRFLVEDFSAETQWEKRYASLSNLIISKLRETGGPTTLSMAGVSDDHHLFRSGTTIAGRGGLWVPVTDTIVSSTVSSFTAFSGESLDTDLEWLLQIRLLLATGSAHQVRIGPGGTFSSANYANSRGRDGAAASTDTNELRLCGTLNAADRWNMDLYIRKHASGGYPTINGTGEFINSTPTTGFEYFAGAIRNTADLTSLDIDSTVASRILADSRATLYRRVV